MPPFCFSSGRAGRSAGCVRLGVEIQNHPPTSQRCEACQLAVLVGKREVGRTDARLDAKVASWDEISDELTTENGETLDHRAA